MSDRDQAQPTRRRLFAGAGAVGALAAVAAVLPGKSKPVAAAPAAPVADASKTGYQATAHVMRYYRTTRV